MSTLTIESNTYPSMVPTPLYCLTSLEFPREAFSGLCYSFYSSMIFLNVYCNPLFADDTKCLSPISPPLDCQLLQSDLDKLSNWSSEWNLLFNKFKCTLLTFSSNNYSSSNLFRITSTIAKSLLVLNTRILVSLCLAISSGLYILLKSLPKHIAFLVCSVELSRQLSASQQETVHTFP